MTTLCPIPSRSHFGPIMPTTQRDAARRRDQKNESKRRRRAELKDSPDHRALINQSQRRRRAELTPSNQDVAKALDTQSRRRKRAELSPEDKDQANALDAQSKQRKRAELSPEDKDQANEERRVKRRIDKESKEVTTAQGPDRQVKARAAKTRALASIHLFKRSTEKPRRRRWPWD